MSFLRLDGISREFVAESGDHVVALDRVSLGVEAGEFISVVGPSGCGKTTLLEIVAGLQRPDAGEVRLDGSVSRSGAVKVGVVFQEDSVLPWRRVLPNVEFGLEAIGAPRASRRGRAQEMVELVGLQGFEESFPAELSGGMRQRVAIARALAMDPVLLLLDEPFGALDEQTRFGLGTELERIWLATGQTVLLITHSINEALMLSDRVVVMSARPGTVQEIVEVPFARPRTTDTMTDARFGELAGRIWGQLAQHRTTVQP